MDQGQGQGSGFGDLTAGLLPLAGIAASAYRPGAGNAMLSVAALMQRQRENNELEAERRSKEAERTAGIEREQSSNAATAGLLRDKFGYTPPENANLIPSATHLGAVNTSLAEDQRQRQQAEQERQQFVGGQLGDVESQVAEMDPDQATAAMRRLLASGRLKPEDVTRAGKILDAIQAKRGNIASARAFEGTVPREQWMEPRSPREEMSGPLPAPGVYENILPAKAAEVSQRMERGTKFTPSELFQAGQPLNTFDPESAAKILQAQAQVRNLMSPPSGPEGSREKVAVDEKGNVTRTYEPASEQYATARAALAREGWQPNMRGYNDELLSLTQQPVPVPLGGRAVARTEGTRPPSFYGNMTAPPPSPGPLSVPGVAAGGVSTPRFKGEPALASEQTTKDVTAAIQMRMASNGIVAALKDPNIDQYIGPFGQWISTIQGAAPAEMLGKIPPSVVALEQHINTLNNYTIRLITGAQMNKEEAPRIKATLPQMSDQPDVLRQKLRITQSNNLMMENQVRTLALQGDMNAKATMAELGLDKLTEIQGPKGEKPPQGSVPLSAAPPQPAGIREVRARNLKTGKGARIILQPGEALPPGYELLP